MLSRGLLNPGKFKLSKINFSSHICSVSDDAQALIWDLTDIKFEISGYIFTIEPLLEYRAEEEISNLAWSLLQNDWLAICWDKSL